MRVDPAMWTYDNHAHRCSDTDRRVYNEVLGQGVGGSIFTEDSSGLPEEARIVTRRCIDASDLVALRSMLCRLIEDQP